MIDPPTGIKAHQGEQMLEISWDDASFRVPYLTLRSECPCASCKNEWTGERVLDPASIRPDLGLEGMEPVGVYAVRLLWNDGHGSGLFTWESLRALCSGP